MANLTETSPRVDVVFDRYEQQSIKSSARSKRSGTGSRPIRHIIDSRDVPMVVSWKQFIDLPENKANLAQFLSEQLMLRSKTLPGYEVVVSGGFLDTKSVQTSAPRDVSSLSSTHEEADTRIILHAAEAFQQGFERTVVVCRDTDVLLLLIHFAHELGEEVWFKAGTAKDRRFIQVHKVQLPLNVRENLPAFHAISGCDTVSQFYGVGKKKSWKVFEDFHSFLII